MKLDYNFLFNKLFPIPRCITGNGYRESLKFLSQYIPFKFLNYKSGKNIYSWTVPKEWNIDDAYVLDKFGNKIKEYTNINDVIMYANSVPDAWCVTKRKIVQDPAFYKKNTSNRILEEVRRFDVDYLLVDVSDQIYQRGKDIVGAIKFYNQLELEKILSDEKNGYHFYKIVNKR